MRAALFVLAVVLGACESEERTPARVAWPQGSATGPGFWCARWMAKPSSRPRDSSTCAREQADCEREAAELRRAGTTVAACAWQDGVWTSSIKGAQALFAEPSHCETMALLNAGSKCLPVY